MAESNILSMLKHILLILLLAFTFVKSQISDKRLCADKECKVIISKAKALSRHPGDHPMMLRFEPGDLISVTSKSAGNNPHLWGGELNGARGYFDKSFVKELKIMVESPLHEVNTEGDIFSKMGPKPSPPGRKPKILILDNVQETDVADEDKNVKAIEDELVLEKYESTVKSNDIVDGQKDDTPGNSFASDETDFSVTGDGEIEEKELHDHIHDDEKQERSEELNKYLKKKLFTSSKSEAGNDGSESNSKEESLKVKPETTDEDKKQNNMQGLGVDRMKHFSDNEDKQNMAVTSTEIPPELAEEDPESLKQSDGEDRDRNEEDTNEDTGGNSNDNRHQSIKPVKGEDDAAEEDDFDPTELDDPSPSEFEEDTQKYVQKEDSDEKEENNIKSGYKSEEDISVESKYVENNNHSDGQQAVDGTSEHNLENKGFSKEVVEDSASDTSGSNDSEDTSKENQAENSKLKNMSSSGGNDLEEKLKTNVPEKTDEVKNDRNESREKSLAKIKKEENDDKDKKETTGKASSFNKEQPNKYDILDSEVRPDTPSDSLSPESAQGEDPIEAAKSKPDAEMNAASLLNKKVEASKQNKLLGSRKDGNNPEPIVQLSDKSLSQSDDELLHKNNNHSQEFATAGSDHVDSADEDKPLGDGFVSFLQSSGTDPKESELKEETPKLNTNPTAAFVEGKDSDSATSKFNIDSSRTDDHTPDATDDKGNKKVLETKGVKTIVEDGSTIVLDEAGDFVTAIMAEGKISQASDMKSSLPDRTSTSSLQSPNPTAADRLPQPSEELGKKLNKNDVETLLQINEQDLKLNSTHPLDKSPGNGSSLLDHQNIGEDYQSSDFISRNLLSVNQLNTQRQQQQSPPTSQQQPSEERKLQEQASVEPTPALSLPITHNTEMISEPPEGPPDTISDTIGSADTINDTAQAADSISDSVGAADNEHSTSAKDETSAGDTAEQIKETVPNHDIHSDEQEVQFESSTQPTPDNVNIPSPLDTVDSLTDLKDISIPSEDYGTDSVYHSRKITDEDLMNEEEQKFAEPSPGFFKRLVLTLERHTKDLFEKLPSSVQSVLEPFALFPNMKLLIATFSIAMLVSTGLISCCFSGGSNKKQQREMLIKFDEMEKKRLIDNKEKQNLEDEIASKTEKNRLMRDEVAKVTEESKRYKSELHTVQLHNETMKKQLTSLQEKVEELQENATSKQGEVKQQSKKTKDLEKHIKKLEERERNLEQTAQKLTSDLKHKEEEVTLLASKVTGLSDQVGHLQTSKDQLLAEAEDWREKVSDLKERLELREEEFKQMQETIMFKENELEVLKDCFLNLKAFEDVEEEGENTEDTSARVQEKIASMMDVSKMNASLRALEEDKNSLANKLEIEMEARRELEEQLESSRRSVESSMADKMKAERQCQEAQTKLSVLSSYFKEKEMQLQRELGEQEALKKQNLTKLVSADETTKTVQQEIEFVRTQNESLKRELASSERDFRSQIAANEKKAHENWLSARAAERELKEARHEAGVLRQKLTDIERRQFMGPGGLIRPLPTRGMPPAGVMNGPPPPGMERSPSRGSLPPLPPLHMRDDDFLASSRGDRGPPPFPLDHRRLPGPPPGMYPLPPDARSPPPRVPPFSGGRSPPIRMPPPGMMDGRSPPPYDRRPPPHHMMDRRSPPPFRPPPPDMLPPHLRGMPLPPHMGRGGSGSPPMGLDSPRQDGRYPLPPYGRNPPPPSDRPSPKQSNQPSPRQQQSQV